MTSKKNKLTFIDLFAGIGGFRIPFEELKCQCVFTSEYDKFAQQTYQSNFGECPKGDITLIDEKEIPKHDILLAGFPCQAFSQAGLKKGFQDTRGTMFFHIARILNKQKPKAFILENVKGLRSHDKGKTLQTIERILGELDYNLKITVLNAKDFGLPQNRERIFIVGFKSFKDASHFEFPTPPKNPTRLGDILHKNAAKNLTISNRIWKSHQTRKKRARAKGYGFGYSLFNRNATDTSTISARYYKDGSEILIEQKNKNPRILSPREAARLQGFPENFKIPVSNSQAFRQFGNAVPVNIVREIAKEIVKILS